MGFRKYIALGAFALASLAFGARGEESVDINQPRVLEFDYKKGEKQGYVFKAKVNSRASEEVSAKVSGTASGYVNEEFGGTLSSNVTDNDNGSAKLEFRIMSFKGKMTGKINDRDISFCFDRKAGDSKSNETFISEDGLEGQQFNIEKRIGLILGNGGDVRADSLGEKGCFGLFPDRPVKKGDSWEYNSKEVSANFKLEGEKEYEGKKCLVIKYSARHESSPKDYVFGITVYNELKSSAEGKIYYDPVEKKLAGFDADFADENSSSVRSVVSVGNVQERKVKRKVSGSFSLKRE